MRYREASTVPGRNLLSLRVEDDEELGDEELGDDETRGVAG
jgi:hypothetical protein